MGKIMEEQDPQKQRPRRHKFQALENQNDDLGGLTLSLGDPLAAMRSLWSNFAPRHSVYRLARGEGSRMSLF